MSGVQQRLNLKRTPIDTWSLREQLSLASAVLRSGDQNWVTVSRMMKGFCEPGRPADWINQKTCALQYNLLEEKFDIKRPKRGEKMEATESPMELIVKKLSQERIAELEKIVDEEKDEILRLEKQTELLSSDDITEDQLQEILKQVEAEEAEEDRKEEEYNEWLAGRTAKIKEINNILRSSTSARSINISNASNNVTQSDQSGSELDSMDADGDAADSPLVSDNIEQDTGDTAPDDQVASHTPGGATPAVVSSASSPSSSPVLTRLLLSPSKTTFPTSPISSLANPYKTPTSGTNLLTKFSSATATTTTTSEPDTKNVVTTTASSVKEVIETSDGVNVEVKEEKDDIKDNKDDTQNKSEEMDTTSADVKEEDNDEDEVFKDKPVINKKTDNTKSEPHESVKPVEESVRVAESKSEVQGLDGVESVPVSPAVTPAGSRSLTPTPTTTTPPSSKNVEEDRDYRAWKKSIILVWGQISQHKNANLFANAVTEADAPDYRDIVFRPMDLNSIKKNVESGHIKTTEEFERDLMLMFFNATMYNSSDHEVYKLSIDMYQDTEKILRDYKNAQLLLKESEPKSLRGKSESAETILTRPRGRSVSGSVGDTTPVSTGSRSDTRKRERSGSMMEDTRADKKRKT